MDTITMQTKIERTISKFDALALRLRIMITLSFIAILFMFFDIFWYAFNDQAIKKTNQQILNIKKQTDKLVNMQKQHNQNILRKRSDPKKIKLASINTQLAEIRRQLTEKTTNLVQPEDMANVLKIIIMSTEALELQRLSKRETIELSDQPDKNDQPKDQIRLYRHSMEILLQGSYSATHKFLEKLENMEKKVAFDSFEYTVGEYPQAEIKLVVSTLSLHKGWIGG